MVQYWQVLNLDKRETLGQDAWGEMHDIVIGGAPDVLVYQLAAGGAADALRKATRDSASDFIPNDANTTTTDTASAIQTVSPSVGSSVTLGSWSGDRIVIISDYALTYPQGMLSPSEMDEIEDMYLDSEDGDGEYDEDDPAPTLYAFAEEWYSAVPMQLPAVVGARAAQAMPQQIVEGHEKDHQTTGQNDKQGDVKGEMKDAKGAQRDHQHGGGGGGGVVGGSYHLRNLTKKEYVRSDAIGAVFPERIAAVASAVGHRQSQSKQPAPGLGHALVVLGCWTSEVERYAGREVGEGQWAGDKIEVRLASEASEAEKEGWKDVSEGATKLLEAVWSVSLTT